MLQRGLDRGSAVFGVVAISFGMLMGSLVTCSVMRGKRTCTLDDAQLARLTPPAPTPAPVAPTPVAPEPVAVVPTPEPPVAPPTEPSWRVDVAKPMRWTNRDGFALRVDLTMTHLRVSDSADPLRAKTTCTVGDHAIVENVGFAPPPGNVLMGERAIGTFIDPFYWNPLAEVPSSCDLHFYADGADAGRFCVTIEPLSVVAEPCPVIVEAPLPTAPAP